MRSPEPIPPLELANRVGSLEGQPDPAAAFDAYGGRLCDDVLASLPEGSAPGDGVVLDFGCGAGRLLRHLLSAPAVGAVHGCDLDHASITWVRQHLPAVKAFTADEHPPLDRPRHSFDLVIAVSVFSHIGEGWEAWMRELHRVTRPDGLLVATFMGAGMRESFLGPDGVLTGMQVLASEQSWDDGGPMVLHSPEWIAEHSARWFSPVQITASGFGAPAGQGQGVFVGRRTNLPWWRRRP